MDNNEDMKVPYEVRPEGTSASLNELALRHRESARYYRDIAGLLKDKNQGAADFFNSLAVYREELLNPINEKLAGMPSGVHTPSRDGEPYLKSNDEVLQKALRAGNTAQLADLAYENENQLSDAYRHALGNDKLLDYAEELLHEQHETVLEWLRKVDRYRTVPQQRNEDFK